MIIYTDFSKNSFASLILLAKYGLPPLSGWFNNMSCLCFLRRRSLLMPLSLFGNKSASVFIHIVSKTHHRVSTLPSYLNAPGRQELPQRRARGNCLNVRQFQYQRSFSPIHLGFKSSFVISSREHARSASPAAHGYQSSPAL
jgi:hypothetical protein